MTLHPTSHPQIVFVRGALLSRVLKHHVIGGIQNVRKAPAIRLSRFDGATIKAMCREFKHYLDHLEFALKSGSDMPNYYLPDEVFHK